MPSGLFKNSSRAFIAFAALCFSSVLAPQTYAQKSADSSSVGILLLAHGGSKEWNANVRAIAAEVDKTQPTVVAFGMADRSAMQAGIDHLTARGVQRIVAVPLFVSSHSSVIESEKFLLGLRSDPPAELPDYASMDMGHGDMPGMDRKPVDQSLQSKPVTSSVPIRMAPALDHHAILANILTDRAIAISRTPKKEVLILVAHGPNEDKENELWLADLSALAKQISATKPFARIDFTTVRDDADASVRDAATAEFRALVTAATDHNFRALIVPVLLSYGGIENGIRKRLDGLDHAFSPSGILPDPRILDWIKASAASAAQ